jgi:hypothetical protein
MKRTIFTLACFLLLMGCAADDSKPYPSDRILIQQFHQQREAFTSLVSDPTNQELLDRVGIIDLQDYDGESPVHTFIVWKKDLFGPGGIYKGYFYSEVPPPRLVQSIDEIYESRTAEQMEVCLPIEEPWYLYYSSAN